MAKPKSSRKKGGSPGANQEALRRHIRAKGADYLKDPNITSVGIGLKNGDGPVCLQFTVGMKGESAIQSLGSLRIPEAIEIDGVMIPTDVIQRSYGPSFKLVKPEQMNARRERIDPIRPGVSVSHIAGTAGTIGLIVYDRFTGKPAILSNWHVLHGNTGNVGDVIVQPGLFDDNNTARNVTGELLRSHLGPAGDCALAGIRMRGCDPSVFELDVVPTRMAQVELGDAVVKSGRTTGVTYGKVRRVDVMARINYGLPAGEQAIGGFEIGPDPAHPSSDGEISKGGDSGSAWLIAEDDKPTDIFAGLHFAGDADGNSNEHALACYPASVQKKLGFLLMPPGGAAKNSLLEEAVPRTGYDANFLGIDAPEPALSAAFKRDAVNFGRSQTIPYTHFSVCLSAGRRMARYVAWNIDGSRMVKLPRLGFALDPRIDAKYQIGEEAYEGNRLDRGHIARRADLCWGDVEEAMQANKDSFYFTNIAPQHERFNQSSRQGLWGELENLVFEQADVQNLKLSVLGGPVFGDEDPIYRRIRLPRAFWKAIVYRSGDGQLRCSAFVLSQDNLLSDLESLDLDSLRIYQISVSDLASRTALDFSAYAAADVMQHPEMATVGQAIEASKREPRAIVEIKSRAEIIF
ncbi:DNA/RNA non-specific endonuclease [Brenneria izadpanahii]|uniref:DNA/RNA non-specific endonuclease n=1 Tax=Brenneria izadpanahii TaxID=2722756 RepID=A0ABX7URD2_9GAMM|nr:DNA/RNA non-specific endonuclease [Brenneria izadpanahii]QTF08169.1 DNA/RNA non-specific endonuclease [Brenneria izadpanahii]